MSRPLLLITNDDGVHAPGIRALVDAVRDLGEAVIVAPERNNSAISHALTMNRPLLVTELEKNIHSLDGTPTDCVMLAVNKILPRKPDLIISGINAGPNLGDDISYSGTVAAAIEGAMHGIPSLAFSLAGPPPYSFGTAAEVARKLTGLALLRRQSAGTILNINIPPLPAGEIRGFRFTRQGARHYKDAIQETLDPWGRRHFWIGGGEVLNESGENTDEQAVNAGYVSITPIQIDMTSSEGLSWLEREWKL